LDFGDCPERTTQNAIPPIHHPRRPDLAYLGRVADLVVVGRDQGQIPARFRPGFGEGFKVIRDGKVVPDSELAVPPLKKNGRD